MNSFDYKFDVPYFHETHDLHETLSFVEFEKVVRPLIDEAISVVDSALNRADKSPQNIDGILLAGGSSQLQYVTETLEARYCRPVKLISKDIMWLIAKGAAIHHRDLLSRPYNSTKPILGASLYIQTTNKGSMEPTLLVSGGQQLPHRYIRDFTINKHNPSLVIQLLTECATTGDHLPLAKRTITFAGDNRGTVCVDISIDKNRTIKVNVLDPQHKHILKNVEITGDVMSSNEEIRRVRQKYGFNIQPMNAVKGDQRFAVGIDLGTTTCEVIVFDLERQCFEHGLPEPQMSQVFVVDNKTVRVDNGDYNPTTSGYFSNFKVDIGGEIRSDSRYHIGDCTWSPEILSAHLLAMIWSQLQAKYGTRSTLSSAVITVPSDFTSDQCAIVERAAKIAGIEFPILLSEPAAAFLTYAAEIPTLRAPEQHYLVFDFGGGTTDVCIVKTQDEPPVSILAAAGNNALGGNDLTRRIADFVVKKFSASSGLCLSTIEQQGLCRQLFRTADKAKSQLSTVLMTGQL